MRFLLYVGAVLAASHAGAGTDLERVAAIQGDAHVAVSRSISLSSPPAVVAQLLERPGLAGQLWTGFDFTPAYQVTATGSGGDFHLEDPTGIVADVRLVATRGTARVYLASGRVDHWAVRGLSQASAAVEVDLKGSAGGGSTLSMTVALKADQWMSGAVMTVLAPIIEGRVEARVEDNLDKAKRIVEAVARSPRGVAQRLEGAARVSFKEIFVPAPAVGNATTTTAAAAPAKPAPVGKR